MEIKNIIVVLSIFIVASVSFGAGEDLVAHWNFDGEKTDTVLDVVSGTQDSLVGQHKYVAGGSGKGLKFDGYTTRVVRAAAGAPKLTDDFSLEAWIAFQAYPWGRCAIVNQCDQVVVKVQEADQDFYGQSEMSEEFDPKAGYFFGVDANGYVLLEALINGSMENGRK